MVCKYARVLLTIALHLIILCSAAIAAIPDSAYQPLPAISLESNVSPFDYWSPRANKGSSRAQFRLAELYEFGAKGITKDSLLAAKWYRLAAEQGYAEAQLRLSNFYLRGKGVEKDAAEAMKWLRAAAEREHPVAQNTLGLNISAGVAEEKNDREAARWFRAAAEHGYSYGQLNIGLCLRDGIGTDQNLAASFSWFKKAAGQGLSEASAELASMYEQGLGVQQDLQKANSIYKQLAEHGYQFARRKLADRKTVDGVADAEQVFQEYKSLAGGGDAWAQYELALKLTSGTGVKQNFSEAAKWYRAAAEKGLAAAQNSYAEILSSR